MDYKNVMLIYNREAGSNKIESVLPQMVLAYQKKGFLMIPFCLNISSKEDILPLLKNNNYAKIIISGGDGSINSIISFLLRIEIFVPIGILPAGTCNDLANSLGLPKNIKKASMIPLKNKTLPIDIGRVNNSHYFFSSLAGGYFTEMSYKTPTAAKKNLKQFAYYFKTATQFSSFKPFSLKATIDGQVIEKDVLMFAFSTGTQIAGFKNIIHDASLNDGKLDLFLIKVCSYFELPAILFNIMAGQFTESKYVTHFQGESFHLEGATDVPIVFDGDKGISLPLTVEVIKEKISLFIP
ncbi:hypothetical protein AZF37_08370 [endosymbiont 'TC1' of Trimyema compressum]|uniref:diacylglycerol/lipid kinase family protein n=1 Tax=endosymbiont 'TC1' of Trimyema compressum TaxID=243899 RepID=UPI0007F04BB6|nr:YegS/Rv2252/BmrU family lipid kinase [endosymbiont 'TC1' of Trimyema compressum]AMP21170.1 hypothetical protein AZF37_08370 [endosymbiont 'TC1' of Trimyema compressum]